jgi:hypothetical protein
MADSMPIALDLNKHFHAGLKHLHVAYMPGPTDPVLDETAAGILQSFRLLGHDLQEVPTDETDILLTTAEYGVPVNWRQSMVLTARRRFKLAKNPNVYTLVHVTPEQLQADLDALEKVLEKEPPDPADYDFPGLAPEAYHVLFEQGRRGGPILALQRRVQAQAKGLRVLLVVGDDRPDFIYHFDLVGAYPKSVNRDEPIFFYHDIALRLTTTISTREVTDHQVTGDPIPYEEWSSWPAPKAMRFAALELGKRKFFTDMVRINDLVRVPAVQDAVANQYSEGCFGTWEPRVEGLIATVTGSARPVDKDNITEDDLAIIVGVRPGRAGAIVRHVDGKRNDPPSSEAVEMMDMDAPLPRIHLSPPEWDFEAEVPVVRSKLHGHRGVWSFDPALVEYAPLNPEYFDFIVSCATEAQAKGVRDAFSRAQCLLNPDDPRQIAFTILPGHGVVIAEKWVPGAVPFQTLWEAMDSGQLVIDSHVPQGRMRYEPDASGQMTLVEEAF